MSYKKFMKAVDLSKAHMGTNSSHKGGGTGSLYDNYKNALPTLYQGVANRLERYTIYDGMEQDPVINWTLDVITDFVSQNDPDIFKIDYVTNLGQNQTTIIETALRQWVKDQDWKTRIFNLVREVLKYGDVIYVRDPDTNVLNKVNVNDVVNVYADENKNPLYYLIKNVSLNVPLKVANSARSDMTTKNLINTTNTNVPSTANNSTIPISGNMTGNEDVLAIPAKDIVHISLNIDQVLLFPFGLSILEPAYKIYIQKCLIQECVLLHRVNNSADKLVFKIPIGSIPRYRRKRFLEKAKNEWTQRRMPSKDSNGQFNTMDVTYASVPMCENYWLPIDADDKNSPSIDKLDGAHNLDQIKDLEYWDNALIRAMKVPQSWIPHASENNQDRNLPKNATETYVQEIRFIQYCKRLQNIIQQVLDKEFKYIIKQKGYMVDEDAFELAFFPPTSVFEVAEMDILQTRLQLVQTANGINMLSKQYILKHIMNMSEDEFNENQRYLLLEKQEQLKGMDIPLPTEDASQVPGLRSVGIADISQELLKQTTEDLNNASSGGDMTGGLGGDMGGDMSADLGGDMGGDMTGGLGSDMGAPTGGETGGELGGI